MLTIFSVALMFLVGCGGGGNSNVKGVSGDNSSFNDNAGGGNETGSGTNSENETSGSWLDYFPKYDDTGLTLLQTTITKQMQISTAECAELRSNLDEKGLDCNDGLCGKYDVGLTIEASFSENGEKCDVTLSMASETTALTEADFIETFGNMAGKLYKYSHVNFYSGLSQSETRELYKNALTNEGFSCGTSTCTKCIIDGSTEYPYYSWQGVYSQVIFKAYGECQF